MKKNVIFISLCSAILVAGMVCSCGNNNGNKKSNGGDWKQGYWSSDESISWGGDYPEISYYISVDGDFLDYVSREGSKLNKINDVKTFFESIEVDSSQSAEINVRDLSIAHNVGYFNSNLGGYNDASFQEVVEYLQSNIADFDSENIKLIGNIEDEVLEILFFSNEKTQKLYMLRLDAAMWEFDYFSSFTKIEK